MRIAVACNGIDVSARFGRCREFAIYDVSGGQVISRCVVPNPGAESGFLPRFLEDMEVTAVIAGGMGTHAHRLFTGRGVAVWLGASGRVEDSVADLISGRLTSNTQPDDCKRSPDVPVVPCITP